MRKYAPLDIRVGNHESRRDAAVVSGNAGELSAWARAHDRGPLVRAVLRGDPGGAPLLARELLDAGTAALVVADPICLGAGATAVDLARLAHVRDATGAGLPAQWDLADAPVDALPLLAHLPAPETAPDLRLRETWARLHRYPVLTVRYGPTFAVIKDVRHPDQAARYVLEEPAMLELVRSLAQPTAVESLSGEQRAHLDDLMEAGLAVVRSGLAVFLAFRLRLWPIPSTAV